MKKTSMIMEKGIDNKVFVKWTNDLDDSIEYSVHTTGINHKEDDHDLIWGHYYGDDFKSCIEYFNQYRRIDDNTYKLVNTVDGKSHVYYTYKNIFGKELEITVNKKKNLYSAYEIFYTESYGKVSRWISEIIEDTDNKTMLKEIFNTCYGII